MLVEKYVVPPRNSNRKFTVSKKTIRRADCIDWYYLTQETQHYVSFEVLFFNLQLFDPLLVVLITLMRHLHVTVINSFNVCISQRGVP